MEESWKVESYGKVDTVRGQQVFGRMYVTSPKRYSPFIFLSNSVPAHYLTSLVNDDDNGPNYNIGCIEDSRFEGWFPIDDRHRGWSDSGRCQGCYRRQVSEGVYSM